MILTGYTVERGFFAFAPAVLVAAAGAVVSDSAWYFTGRWGSRRFIKLYCKCSFGSGSCVERTERNLRRFGAPSLIYARFIPGFRTLAAPMAGMSGVPYRAFLLFDGIGAVLWASLGVTTGIVFAREIPALAGRIEDSRRLLLFLAAGAVVLFLLLKWWMRQRHGQAELATVEAKTSRLGQHNLLQPTRAREAG
ncbi:MAG: DedA family protein [Acidobacteria bacterium]|nr:DedA family protein [Acidobacteriota bacterium]